VHGANAHLDRAAERLTAQLARVPDAAGGRVLAQAIATTVAAALLVRHAPPFVADAYPRRAWHPSRTRGVRSERCPTEPTPPRSCGAAPGTRSDYWTTNPNDAEFAMLPSLADAVAA